MATRKLKVSSLSLSSSSARLSAPKLSLNTRPSAPQANEGVPSAASPDSIFPSFQGLTVSTDELLRLINESADSLERMTKDLNDKSKKGTGAVPDIGLPDQPVLNSQVLKAQQAQKAPEPEAEPPEDINALKEELNGYIGLNTIKEEVNSLINYVTIMQKRKEQGLPTPDLSLHMVFSGNPGTGKTMIARFMSRVYKSLGILSKGHLVETDRSGLVAGYVGQTAIKTKEVIDKAKGGVLFIDEAYALTNRGGENDFGQEAVDTLLKAMEDHREDLVVIVAGYTELMEEFVHSNPGLESRFNRFMHFPDYTVEEMTEIFKMRCGKSGYTLAEDAEEKLKEILEKESRDIASFGNARGVRNLFERAIAAQADRLAAGKEALTKDSLMCLRAEDLRAALKEAEDEDDHEAGEDEAPAGETT